MKQIETPDDFLAAYREQMGEFAYHITPLANLESITASGIDPDANPAERGIGGSRPGHMFYSTRQPHSTSASWARFRIPISAFDPGLIGPDDDALGAVGFFEDFGDDADRVHDSWGYHEQGEYVAQKSLEMDLHDNFYAALSTTDFSYSGVIDSSQLQIQLPGGEWQQLREFMITRPAEAREISPRLRQVLDSIYRIEIEDEDGVEVPHAMLQDPEQSAGLCVAASKALASHVNGLRRPYPMFPEPSAHVVDGKDPHTGTGLAHTWTEIVDESDRYAVDLTAAQFGIDEFPLIAKRSLDVEALEQALGVEIPRQERGHSIGW